MVGLNLTEVFDEEERRELLAYLEELRRCCDELKFYLPELERMGQVDLENFLETDAPHLRDRVDVLQITMGDVRKEIQEIFERASTRLCKAVCNALLLGSELTLDESDGEQLLTSTVNPIKPLIRKDSIFS